VRLGCCGILYFALVFSNEKQTIGDIDKTRMTFDYLQIQSWSIVYVAKFNSFYYRFFLGLKIS
jgi:hypothetical protein